MVLVFAGLQYWHDVSTNRDSSNNRGAESGKFEDLGVEGTTAVCAVSVKV
jgi:hypothetical protein